MALNQYGQGLANQDYGNWLSRLQGLGAQGPTAAAGQTGRQGSLAGIDTGLGNAQAGVWNNLTNNVTNGYTQGQQADAASNAQGGANLFSALLGGANLGLKASGVGGFAPATNNYYQSDRNSKTDIEKLGTDRDSGLDIYSYRYKTDPKTYPKVVGPMAQDVEKKYPGFVLKVGKTRIVRVAA